MKNILTNLCLALTLLLSQLATADVVYVHNDILGSPIMETDEQGNVISRSHYKPFGETLEAPKDDVGYTGHLNDTDLGLTYMQARYYDSVIGRFYSNDPIGAVGHLKHGNLVHGFNRYTYANNNPYKYVDPDGNFPGEAIRTRKLAPVAEAVGKAIKSPTLQRVAVRANLDATLTKAALTGDVKTATKALNNYNKPSVKQQAENLVGANGGKHRVTLTSTSQKVEIDLKGASHGGVPTPHTKTSTRNEHAPNQPAYNTKQAEVTATTQQEIRAARKYLEKENNG